VRNLVLQILLLAGICFSQLSSPTRKGDSPLIDQRKPSVYLSFMKSEKLTSKYGGDVQVVWLDIRNTPSGTFGPPDRRTSSAVPAGVIGS
jgi:hypothetical protein